MSNSLFPHTNNEDTPPRVRRATPPMPRWVKVSIVIIILLVVAFLILHLTGHGFSDHMHMSMLEAGRHAQ